MPRTNITVTEVTRAGVAAAAEAAGDQPNGNQVLNDGHVLLLVHNTHATLGRTITFVTPGTVDALAVADRVVTVGATLSVYIGPFPTTMYNTGNYLYIDPQDTDVKIVALRLPLQ